MTEQFLLPISEYHRRLEGLRRAMSAKKYDVVVVYSDEYRPGNGTYLTNYKPINVIEEAPQMVIVPSKQDPIALMGRLNTFGARTVSWVEDIRPIDELEDVIAKIRERNGSVERVAVVGEQLLPIKYYDGVRSSFKGCELVRDEEILARLRQYKSEPEIRMLEQSARVGDESIIDTVEALRPGVSETELAAISEYGARRRNAEIGSAYVIIAGANTRFPTWRPHPDHHVQDGDYVIIDASPSLRGYSADVAITAIVGEGDPVQRQHLQVANEIVAAVIEEDMRPGMTIDELYSRVLSRVQAAKLEEYFLPWAQGMRAIGHGVGLDVVEWPNLGPGSDVVLEPGMAVSLKLDLHGIPSGGIRVERMVVIDDDRARGLNFNQEVLAESVRPFV